MLKMTAPAGLQLSQKHGQHRAWASVPMDSHPVHQLMGLRLVPRFEFGPSAAIPKGTPSWPRNCGTTGCGPGSSELILAPWELWSILLDFQNDMDPHTVVEPAT